MRPPARSTSAPRFLALLALGGPPALPAPRDAAAQLGVNCADPYTSGLNGSQTLLGPKFEVDALRGFHPHPVTMQGISGDEIYKHLQVHDADLIPALNAGARYFVEGQYVAEDDAAA